MLRRTVSRPRLTTCLDAGLTGKLILVSAPAGFGKSTLVADWINCLGDHVYEAWLSLGPEENELGRFLTCLAAAVVQMTPHLRPLIRAAFEGEEANASLTESVTGEQFAPLLNALAALDRQLILVLDDYHLITDCAVHALLRSLICHLPETVTVVVVTRADPPLPLGRLAIQRQLTSIRAADLRFSTGEASEFLSSVMGLDLPEAAVELLARRSEGWITGLQLAGLSLQKKPDTAGFLQEFAGDDHNIRRYLVDEVLAGQPPEIQQFLLVTSILERLTAPLCEAVLDADEAGPVQERSVRTMTAQQALEYLEERNVFIVALDEYGQWYRYHTLFAELLRFHLWREQRESLPILHRRAAGWLEQQGFTDEATRQALAVGDTVLANTIRFRAQQPASINARFALLLNRLRGLALAPQNGTSPTAAAANGHQYARGEFDRVGSLSSLHDASFSAKGTERAAQEAPAEPLSEREREVLNLLALGLSYQDIAQRLFISLPTVKTHISHIYGKLDVHCREDAVQQASQLGILSG
jgi:LuxR family maltose regulon positive regulatory protein